MHSPVSFTHMLWKGLLRPGLAALDATCGNGHDTLALAKLLLTQDSGSLIGYDIQEQAIEKTRALLEKELSPSLLARIDLRCASHAPLSAPHPLDLIVYNLGYLPGGDKSLTTLASTTLISLQSALPLLSPSGALSLLCYVGHAEGEREHALLQEFLSQLPNSQWVITRHLWHNCRKAPELFFIQRRFL